jgi:sulfur carrier protein
MSVRVTVNGRQRELPDGATVARLVELLAASSRGRGVAVAVGGEVVPRGSWQHTALCDGAAVAVVSAVQGG